MIPRKNFTSYAIATFSNLNTSNGRVTACDSFAEGKVISISDTGDPIIEIHDLLSSKKIAEFTVPRAGYFWNEFENCLSQYYGVCHGIIPLPDGHFLMSYNSSTLDVKLIEGAWQTQHSIPALNQLFLKNAILMDSCLITFGSPGYYQAVNIMNLKTLRSNRFEPACIQQEGWIHCIAALSSHQLAMSVGHKIALFDFDHEKLTLEKPQFFIAGEPQERPSQSRHALVPLPQNRLLSIGLRDGGSIKLWDTLTMRCLARSEQSIAIIQRNKFRCLPDGETVLSLGTRSNELCLWDLKTLKPHIIDLNEIVKGLHILDLDVLPNGQIVLATEADGIILAELSHILELKLKKQILETGFLDKDVTHVIANYVGTDVKISGYSMNLFKPADKGESKEERATPAPPHGFIP